MLDVGQNESIVKNEDDSYSIFINPSLTCEKQREEFIHAVIHIADDHFSSGRTATELEYNAHLKGVV